MSLFCLKPSSGFLLRSKEKPTSLQKPVRPYATSSRRFPDHTALTSSCSPIVYSAGAAGASLLFLTLAKLLLFSLPAAFFFPIRDFFATTCSNITLTKKLFLGSTDLSPTQSIVLWHSLPLFPGLFFSLALIFFQYNIYIYMHFLS